MLHHNETAAGAPQKKIYTNEAINMPYYTALKLLRFLIQPTHNVKFTDEIQILSL